MKKLFIVLICIMYASASVRAQQTETYRVIVSFNSECCGVPSDTPLVKMIKGFKKQYKLKQVSADRIGPMGREGEYYLAFRLKELNRAQQVKFIQQLKKTVSVMKDKGSAEVRENEVIDRSGLSRGALISPVNL